MKLLIFHHTVRLPVPQDIGFPVMPVLALSCIEILPMVLKGTPMLHGAN